MSEILVIDYGMGNIASVVNIVNKMGGRVRASNKPEEVLKANKLILPGVGHFEKAIQNLHERGLFEATERRVTLDKVPILGICLGMQLMTRGSEEGNGQGFGWFDAETRRFQFDSQALVLPHMGWNTVYPAKDDMILDGITERSRFYFVHAYHVVCHDSTDVLLTAQYGYRFCCAISRSNMIGVQFHPEKSHRFGMTLIANFIRK
jgi:imidazole glycerol-phosphate synthase subunit HisH